jgi:NADH-quinone oxidoreductase subunit L
MNDIKRVLAYSTISQLGYRMLGLGVFGYAAAMFHLFNHAFFKALLFLGAGSANHATGTFDMRQMGGLRKAMPWTFATYLIASISIAGIWPFAGFWSKDEILAHALEHQPALFVLALITVFMTAFYMFRTVFMTFGGEYRGGAGGEHSKPHLHESPAVMVVPMVVLAVLSVGSGWFNFVEGGFPHFLEGAHGEPASFFFTVLAHPWPWVSLLMGIAGILLAYAMYSAKWVTPERMGQLFAPFYKLFSRKYWFDELYEQVFVVRFLVNGLFWINQLFDTYIVDGLVNGVAEGTLVAGRGLRRLQTGQLQLYGFAIAVGVLFIAGAFYLFA